MKTKISETQLIKLAQIYNAYGKKELYRVLQEEYNISNKCHILKRMKKRNLIDNDKKPKNIPESTDSVFMSMDELCTSVVSKTVPDSTNNTASITIEQLVEELIKDRLLELSKYMNINSSGRIVTFDRTTLLNDGYQVIIH